MSDSHYTLQTQVTFTRVVDIRDSSNVAQVAYDPVTTTLMVEFTNRNQYVIEDVSPETFGLLVSAESVGKAYQSLIYHHKNHDKSYVYHRVEKRIPV